MNRTAALGAPHLAKGTQMAIKLDFKQSTWDKAKPKDLKKDNLSSALKDVEKSMGDEKKLAGCIAALREVMDAADDLMGGDCNAKKNKDLHSALKKLASDSAAEIKRLQAAMESASEEDEDEDDGDIDKLLGKDKFGIFLKKAKSADTADRGAGFCFCFHKVDGDKCELVLIPPAKINSKYAKLKSKLPKIDSDYKKRNILTGMAYRDDKFLVLECFPGEEPPEVPGMDKKIRRWAKSHKRDIAPMKKVRISIPGMAPMEIDVPEEDEVDVADAVPKAPPVPPTGGATAAAAGVPPQAPPAPNGTAGTPPQAPPSPTATAAATGTPPQAPPAPNGTVDAAAVENRRKEFRKARQAWQAAKEKAIQDLEMVKDRIRDYYLDDPEMFKVVSGKLKQLDGVMDNIGDELRDILDKYVSTPMSKQTVLQQLAADASATVNRFLDYVSKDALLNAVDNEEEMGVADIKVREPLQNALRKLVSTLG
jgi:hypothetical protein